MHFFAVSVTCTLQVFWALVHGQLCMIDWCCFYYFLRNSLVALLEALFARYTGVFLYQRTHLRTHSLKIVHICVYVYMCVFACICIWMRMCVYDIAWHVEVLLLGFSICAYVYICMCMSSGNYACIYMSDKNAFICH